MDDIEKQIVAIFHEESNELLARLSQSIEELVAKSSEDLKSELVHAMRLTHNLKGAAATVGLQVMEELAHTLEEMLLTLSVRNPELSEGVIEVMQDCVTAMIQAVEGQDIAHQTATIIEKLTRYEAEAGAKVVSSDRKEDEPQMAPKEKAPTPRKAAEGPQVADEGKSLIGSVRMDLARLDNLMSYTGELFITHARLARRNEDFEEFLNAFIEAYNDPGYEREMAKKLARQLDGLIQQDRRQLLDFGFLTNEIGTAMKRIRMLPLKSIASSWRKIVYECARELQKNVKLSIQIGDIEIDKQILDSLVDPIRHLLRNAVDHGIETADQRAEAGKSKTGHILIRANMRGTMVRLEFSDDGPGLNRTEIEQAAIDRGLLAEKQLGQLSDREIYGFLCVHGFSLADKVSRISGRGVGLDVVRTQVEELNGTLEISDKPTLGGTTFLIDLPVSLLLTKGLLINDHGTVYALPIDNVLKTLRVDRNQLKQANGSPAILLEDTEPLRVRELTVLMGGPPTVPSQTMNVVVVSHAGAKLGIIVEQVIREEKFVTKHLPWNIVYVQGINGALILGDGSLALTVDVPYLFSPLLDEEEDLTEKKILEPKQRILVVDDSLTARILAQNTLTEAGFEVVVESDGEGAWNALQAWEIDMVVSDVQMPRLNGFELTRRIRANSRYRHLPVILVSKRDASEDISKGAEVGADEYLVKGKFDQKRLVESVRNLL